MEKELFDIFFEIVEGAKIGKIPTALFYVQAGFETVIKDRFSNVSGDGNHILYIDDFNQFMNTLKRYFEIVMNTDHMWFRVSEEKNHSYLRINLVYLLANMTPQDFQKPTEFVNRYIEFLNDRTFSQPMTMEYAPLDCKIHIERKEQPAGQETPYALSVTMEKEYPEGVAHYTLPLIRYGVANNRLYLYAIQGKNNEDIKEIDRKFAKKANRYFYKMNKNCREELQDVPLSFMFASTILLKCMQEAGIEDIVIAKSLPLKVEMKKNVFGDMTKYKGFSASKLKALGVITNVEEIEYNLTTRFLHVVERLREQIDGISFKGENNSFLTADVNEKMLFSENEVYQSLLDSTVTYQKRK
ncbi:MAG TPA: hypothetical protein IAD49_01220 [Candidatus Fimihabitans intestinipullorum]|uniref:Uncharacterized protein n=1 Tax=Candidatus Fimihabitans intestinipullorum TaxID=2840820 RepID=A0A9D1L256_9BACT|nr:hypothetical protein [Candidatus Fimihabitans intestinipullorum]